MDIVCLCVGALQENCYLVGRSAGPGPALVIDPGDEPDRILEAATERDWTVERVVLTHGHADHTGGAMRLRDATGARIAGSEREKALFTNPVQNGAAWLGLPSGPVALDESVGEGRPWHALDRDWIVLDTPGHTPGHVALYAEPEGVLFSGDVLFADSVGRTDLPGGSWERLARTLRETIFTLPDSVRVYPGHGPSTTLGQERVSNPFVREALEGHSVFLSPPLFRFDPER